EPQDYPDDIPYPGAPPTPPYDIAGWTLALQMGVRFDRILDGFDGPFETLADVVRPQPGRLVPSDISTGYTVSRRRHDAFLAVNRLVKAGMSVDSLPDSFYVTGSASEPLLQKAASDLGLTFTAVPSAPPGGRRLRPMRVGLWDSHGGSVESGWLRWLFER